jgi:hypothetical protein
MKRTSVIAYQSLMKYNWEYACADGFSVMAGGLHMFRMGGTVAGGEMNPSEKLSFRKRALVGRTF